MADAVLKRAFAIKQNRSLQQTVGVYVVLYTMWHVYTLRWY